MRPVPFKHIVAARILHAPQLYYRIGLRTAGVDGKLLWPVYLSVKSPWHPSSDDVHSTRCHGEKRLNLVLQVPPEQSWSGGWLSQVDLGYLHRVGLLDDQPARIRNAIDALVFLGELDLQMPRASKARL